MLTRYHADFTRALPAHVPAVAMPYFSNPLLLVQVRPQLDQLSDLLCRGGPNGRIQQASYTLPMFSTGSTSISAQRVSKTWCPPQQRKRAIVLGLAFWTWTDFYDTRAEAETRLSNAALVIEEHAQRSLMAIDQNQWCGDRGSCQPPCQLDCAACLIASRMRT